MESDGVDAVAMALMGSDGPTLEDADRHADELELDAMTTESEEEETKDNATAFYSTTTAPPPPATPVSAHAPLFPAVHQSWEAFDAQLKAYAQATYQLYVVRTTTSVHRRNLRIAELAATTASAVDTDDGADEEGEEDVQRSDASDRLKIPAHLKWYSKTMMCTHGWKDRHRGTGKRSMTMVRSTGCPVKMCITLQHTNETDDDDDENEGWRVVVTKHIRTHNHPLSKELYLFYTENRRIYDPELLALVGGNSPSGAMLAAEFYGAFGEEDDENTLGTGEDSIEDTSTTGSVPLMTIKAFDSWEHFHDVLADYSMATQQHFRIRSTISAQSKNAKTMEQATKSGKSAEEVSVHLVPEAQKWYSKLLICNHGWKRKSRSKVAQIQRQTAIEGSSDLTPPVCPAMVMARLQRDIHDNWRIVINRQVTNHNHALYALDSSEADQDVRLMDGMPSDLEEGSTTAEGVMNPQLADHHAISAMEDRQHEEFVNAAVQHLGDLNLPSTSQNASDQELSQGPSIPASSVHTLEASLAEGEVPTVPRPMSVVTEVVVRVAKLPAIHVSWEAFHECLQQYSESTYQSYRTRTTSSVAGRNQKILEMRANSENSLNNAAGVGDDGSTGTDGLVPETARLIPGHYKWYSKTLTCTHGWKERRRGAGKRTIHVVRSTLCPVKICATLQYLEADATNSGEEGWRVVVTKHIVDHNHNLSKELFQYYRDNRRIYDPALLAIDQSQTSTPVATDTSAPNGVLLSSMSQAPDSAPLAEQQPSLFSGGAPTEYDHSDAFNGQHALPESAYLVPNPANPNTQILLMTGGVTLANFATIPTSTTPQSTPTQSLYASAPASMHQMFPPGAMLPVSAFPTGQLADSATAAPGSPTTSVICQLHGNLSSNQALGAEGAECTCLRIPIVHQFTSGGTASAPSTTSSRSSGKRQARSTGPDEDSVGSSKRVRPDTDNSRVSNALDAPATASTTPSDPPAEVWSPTNPVQAISVTEADGTVVWRAPRLKRRHENWAEFTDNLNAYSASTLQLYRVRTTSSIAARNVRISQQLQQMQDDGGRSIEHADDEEFVPHLIPASYEWYSKTYVCTHGWKERRRGKGQRVSHNLRSTACPVKLCVTLQRDPLNSENWNVVVTKHVLDHNHEISQSLFQSYSENRRIKDPALLAQAEQMWRDGQPRRSVFEFLKGATKTNLVMKDIHNLVQRWQQQQETSPNVMDALARAPHPHHSDDHDHDLDLIGE